MVLQLSGTRRKNKLSVKYPGLLKHRKNLLYREICKELFRNGVNVQK
jgi:hypothetical protein